MRVRPCALHRLLRAPQSQHGRQQEDRLPALGGRGEPLRLRQGALLRPLRAGHPGLLPAHRPEVALQLQAAPGPAQVSAGPGPGAARLRLRQGFEVPLCRERRPV